MDHEAAASRRDRKRGASPSELAQAAADHATTAALRGLPEGWTVRHHVAFPSGLADVDDHVTGHLLVGPTGVFVVDSLGAGPDTPPGVLDDAFASVVATARAVTRLLRWENIRLAPDDTQTLRWGSDLTVTPVLCLDAPTDAPAEAVATGADGNEVVVVRAPRLRDRLVGRPTVLRPADVAMVTWALHRTARPDEPVVSLSRRRVERTVVAVAAACLVAGVASAGVAARSGGDAAEASLEAASGTTVDSTPAAAGASQRPSASPTSSASPTPSESAARSAAATPGSRASSAAPTATRSPGARPSARPSTRAAAGPSATPTPARTAAPSPSAAPEPAATSQAWDAVGTVAAAGSTPAFTVTVSTPRLSPGGAGGRLWVTAVEVRNTGDVPLSLAGLRWSMTGALGGRTLTVGELDRAVAGDVLGEQPPVQPGASRSDLLVWQARPGFAPRAVTLRSGTTSTTWGTAAR